MKFRVLCLLSFLPLLACKKNNDSPLLLEISPLSAKSYIQAESNQVEFNFSLLNENGQSSTTFNKGENFTFSFSFKNLSTDTIIVTTEFLNSDFFRVFLSQNNTDMGKPWTGEWCMFNGGPQHIVLLPNSKFDLRCPWILRENAQPVYPLCMAESKAPLEAGEYFTGINLDFHFSSHNATTVVNSLKFKINFKILL